MYEALWTDINKGSSTVSDSTSYGEITAKHSEKMNKKQPSKYNKLDTKQRSFGSWNKDLIVQLSNASAELYWKLHKTDQTARKAT